MDTPHISGSSKIPRWQKELRSLLGEPIPRSRPKSAALSITRNPTIPKSLETATADGLGTVYLQKLECLWPRLTHLNQTPSPRGNLFERSNSLSIVYFPDVTTRPSNKSTRMVALYVSTATRFCSLLSLLQLMLVTGPFFSEDGVAVHGKNPFCWMFQLLPDNNEQPIGPKEFCTAEQYLNLQEGFLRKEFRCMMVWKVYHPFTCKVYLMS
jgi:hypothetical protein